MSDDDWLIGDTDYRDTFGEDLSKTLDIDTWDTGPGVERAMARLRQEIGRAVNQEDRLRVLIREEILPLLRTRPKRPVEGGVYTAEPDELQAIHGGLLFTGDVEAVAGISSTYDSLPIGITQLGIALIGYGGTSGTFAQRLFRRDMSIKGGNAFQEAREFIENRQNRFGAGGQKDHMTELARRCIRTLAERLVLMDKAKAEWRIGQGNPVSQELLTGSGYMELLDESLAVLRRLIQEHKKFVFVPSTLTDRGLLTIGYALNAGEYAIIDTLEKASGQVVDSWRYGGRHQEKAAAFVRECCSQVLRGLYRVSESSAPRLFYAHRDHVHVAARVAMADSILRPERGFPMLIDVASVICRAAFGSEGFMGMVQDAYAQVGENLRFFNERDTRR